MTIPADFALPSTNHDALDELVKKGKQAELPLSHQKTSCLMPLIRNGEFGGLI